MRFEGTFRVPAEPRRVLDAFADIERMVPCMPGASLEGRDEEGLYLGTMTVAFGPKKIRFKGKIRGAVDPQALRGTLDVRGAADMRMPAPAAVHVEYAVTPAADATAASPASVVTLVSEAELGGVLADFARTGGNAVTQALMEMFARNLADVVGSAPTASPASVAADVVTPPAAPQPSQPRKAPQSLSAFSLLWLLIKAKFSAVFGARRP